MDAPVVRAAPVIVRVEIVAAAAGRRLLFSTCVHTFEKEC